MINWSTLAWIDIFIYIVSVFHVQYFLFWHYDQYITTYYSMKIKQHIYQSIQYTSWTYAYTASLEWVCNAFVNLWVYIAYHLTELHRVRSIYLFLEEISTYSFRPGRYQYIPILKRKQYIPILRRIQYIPILRRNQYVPTIQQVSNGYWYILLQRVITVYTTTTIKNSMYCYY